MHLGDSGHNARARGGERERREIDVGLRALCPSHPHTLGYIGVCDQEQGETHLEIWSGSEEGSCLRHIDCCITQLLARV